MKLYFLRHGLAGERAGWKGDDAARPLTKEGIAKMNKSAATLAKLGLELDLIITSPLVRAYQTAEIVAQQLDMQHKLVKEARLGTEFGPMSLLQILADHPGANGLMLVGHEPGMSETVRYLTGGGQVVLEKGGLACVHVADKSLKGELVWLLPPEVLAL